LSTSFLSCVRAEGRSFTTALTGIGRGGFRHTYNSCLPGGFSPRSSRHGVEPVERDRRKERRAPEARTARPARCGCGGPRGGRRPCPPAPTPSARPGGPSKWAMPR
jgi:hypothetical protein